jgi:uncharacterized membrane protein YqaE (UPF0057 family)/DNA-directed RNA polymerase subunit RPC12/RpoP
MYFLAIFFPPLAVAYCGKSGSVLASIILTLCGWLPGAIHAICIVSNHNAEKRAEVQNAMIEDLMLDIADERRDREYAAQFVVYDCPSCGMNLESDRSQIGMVETCPKCRTPIEVPDW